MIIAVDLPAPGLLWTRWVTLAAALSALGHRDVWSVDDAGAHHDDGGGNWSHLTLVADGRAVLYGCDHEYSDTTAADPPLDLLDGAPDWLPWDDLLEHAATDQLGYVLWHDGTGWRRVDYPGGEQDGLAQTAGAVLDAEATVAELVDFVFEWGEHDVDTPGERASVRAAAGELLAAGARGDIDGAALTALLGRLTGPAPDAAAGRAVAARGGLTPGAAAPRTAAGRRPQRRRVRKLSDHEHDRLIWAAMHAEPERARPEPVPTGELGALVTWLRGRAPGGDGRCCLRVYADASSLAAQPGELAPADRPGEGRFGAFGELSDLVRRLRAAEAGGEPGRWLFLRVDTTADAVTVERRYDSWPPWWQDNGISGPWRGNLRSEVEARGPGWRPSWAALLDPEVAYRSAE
ncbi:hypothetical protein GCM10020358_64930 [Amorphoplanes nipponensis]|uniref:Uncharacterized protein n=1 Tax=Actinoplanes nipponensis TaxID=135950 RepID=A0A919JCG5_9ACTN|nr:hypothetical protein [Actinoplanes nipponensis]GIE48449.1 hypothetical protein Ani05nite_19830 [Actinoplanes nipponensis]